MKLKIKETGEILEDVKFIDTTLHKITIQYLDDGVLRECSIKNLSDVEEVKDYEEPKGTALYWMILTLENFIENEPDDKWIDLEDCKQMLERLKAWERLKDKGFRFKGKKLDSNTYKHYIEFEVCSKDVILFSDDIEKDLDLLFGGEDE